MERVMYGRWILFAFANLVMLALGYVLAPILPLFAIGRETLPVWLSWFQTPDNPLDGDSGWKTVHWQWRFRLPRPIARYVGRVGWLWRNPSYGFDVNVLGFAAAAGTELIRRGTSPLSGDLVTGWYFATAVTPDGRRAWQLYAVKVWGRRASRVNLGWKLWSVPGRCQFAMTVNPFLSTK
ncbi:hypothetical protein C6Q35_28310 [Burkholderia multivorans]|nr:hypothetical protein C6P79_07130 [Burkholderia multivorans]PRG17962.1 hypothetical protein C6Q35_28310 [Burkholderia multivorans]